MVDKILVTGATGFIGSFIAQEALRQGFETWAAVRKTSSRKYLKDANIHFIELDFDSEKQLMQQLEGHQFDYVVHAAGVTKCADKKDFLRVNYQGTRNLVNALIKLRMPVKKLVYMSSLSVFGAIREDQPYKDILTTDSPLPNTEYGKSKIEAERFLQSKKDELNFTILRPTGVYGPREKDYFLMAKSIKQHIDFSAGYSKQVITFVYVQDVVDAVFLALKQEKSGNSYFLTDGEKYESEDFSNLIIQELGNPWCLRLKAPLWLLKTVTMMGDLWGRLTGKVTALNNDKYHILAQRNWCCDVGKTMEGLGYEPKVKLAEGVKITIQWYKENKWL